MTAALKAVHFEDPVAAHIRSILEHLGENPRREGLAEQVADALVKVLAPKGVGVMAEAQHLCMAMRGVQKQQAATTTRAARGAYQELLPLIKGN